MLLGLLLMLLHSGVGVVGGVARGHANTLELVRLVNTVRGGHGAVRGVLLGVLLLGVLLLGMLLSVGLSVRLSVGLSVGVVGRHVWGLSLGLNGKIGWVGVIAGGRVLVAEVQGMVVTGGQSGGVR